MLFQINQMKITKRRTSNSCFSLYY